MRDRKRWWLGGALLAALACGDDDPWVPGAGDAGDATLARDAGDAGASSSSRDASTRGDAAGAGMGMGMEQECSPLLARIRDFQNTHSDFETFMNTSATLGLVQANLGADHKPVLASTGNPQQVTSASSFAQWYNDVPGVNQAIEFAIPLEETSAGSRSFEYNNSAFFPIDRRGFGNQSSDPDHNFHFTTEVHTSFTYRGGEVFTFSGDDDLWIFVNGKLALDLGGLHPPLEGTITFDAQAQQLGITKGNSYRMDIFHAERHTVQSNFRVRTNIDCFVNVDVMVI